MSGDIILDISEEWPGRGRIWDSLLRFHRVKETPITDAWMRKTPARYLTTEPEVGTHGKA